MGRRPQTLEHDPLFKEEGSPQLPVVTGLTDEHDDVDDVTALNNVLSELGADENGNGFVTVFKEVPRPNGGKEDAFISRYSICDFSLDELKSQHGAGRYKISVYRNGGGLATRKTIPILPSAVPEKPAVSVGGADTAAILASMQQGFREMGELLVKAAQSNQPVAPSRMELLQEMQTMAEIFGNRAPAAPSMDPMAMFKMGIDIARDAANPDGDSSWINKMIPLFEPLLATMVQSPAPEPVGKATPVKTLAAAPSAAATTAPQTSPAPKPQTDEEPMSIMLTGFIRMMVSAAAQDQPIDEYSVYMLNLAPDSMLPQIEDTLNRPDWLEYLKGKAPQIAQYEDWFTRLRNRTLEILAEERGIDSLTGVEVGTNLAPHEATTTTQPGIDSHPTITT